VRHHGVAAALADVWLIEKKMSRRMGVRFSPKRNARVTKERSIRWEEITENRHEVPERTFEPVRGCETFRRNASSVFTTHGPGKKSLMNSPGAIFLLK
jgi:hypothetical protein